MFRLLAAALVLICLATASTADNNKPSGEKEKIEALIRHVEGLRGATFIRNDRDYDAKTAARFLRGKWQANERSIRTAGDFINKAASASGTTGKAYRIRLADGKETASGDYLHAVLKKLETPTKKP